MLKVTRTIKHHVNMGNYEWVEVSGSAEMDTDDANGSVARATDILNDVLNEMVAADLAEAGRLTVYGVNSDDANEKSYATEWRK